MTETLLQEQQRQVLQRVSLCDHWRQADKHRRMLPSHFCDMHVCVCVCSPDLACLEHHEHLSRLDVAAPLGSRWCLHALQLGCLVHLGALKELRLAETVDDDYCATTSAGGAGGSSSSNISSRGGSFSRSKTAGYKPGPPCNKASRCVGSCVVSS